MRNKLCASYVQQAMWSTSQFGTRRLALGTEQSAPALQVEAVVQGFVFGAADVLICALLTTGLPLFSAGSPLAEGRAACLYCLGAAIDEQVRNAG